MLQAKESRFHVSPYITLVSGLTLHTASIAVMRYFILPLLTLVIVGCAQKSVDPVTIIRELGPCSNEGFTQKLQSTYPHANVILCDPNSLIFQVESSWASQEYRLIDFKNNDVYAIHAWEMGGICTDEDGCDTVSRDECRKSKSCTPGTLFQFSTFVSVKDGGERVLAQWKSNSASTVVVTMQDWLKNAHDLVTRDSPRMCSMHFHVDGHEHTLTSEYCE